MLKVTEERNREYLGVSGRSFLQVGCPNTALTLDTPVVQD
jgi:hypothetical protein